MSGAALAAVENKIPNVSNQVKKANYDTNINILLQLITIDLLKILSLKG